MKRLISVVLIICTWNSMAENRPMDDENDARLKTIVYKKNDVVPIKATFKHATYIDLGEGNRIIDVLAGDTESWLMSLTAKEDGILIKPTSAHADTNLIVITEKRKYFFDLARGTEGQTYGVRFVYPEEEFNRMKAQIDQKKASDVNFDLGIEKAHPEDWNFAYVLKGSKATAPLNIFDDGRFTYLEFGKKEIPAFFAVDLDKSESVVNFHKSGQYIVLEGVFRQLTMRNGSVSSCIFNKSYDQMTNTSLASVE